MFSFLNTFDVPSIMHGCATSHAVGINRASPAQQLRCRANILPAMHGTGIVHELFESLVNSAHGRGKQDWFFGRVLGLLDFPVAGMSGNWLKVVQDLSRAKTP